MNSSSRVKKRVRQRRDLLKWSDIDYKYGNREKFVKGDEGGLLSLF